MSNMVSLYILVAVFLLIIAIVVIMRRQFKPKKINFTYNQKDEKVYRNVFEDVSPDNKTNGANPSNGYSVVLAVFPLYGDDGKSVGTLRSTSSILKNVGKMSDEVSQNINYVLKDGTISVRRYFKNDDSVIREESFKVPIISGTGSYTDKKGTVEVKVNGDSRDLMIEIVGEY